MRKTLGAVVIALVAAAPIPAAIGDIIVSAGFQWKLVHAGPPLNQATGIAVGQGNKLWLSDLGEVVHGGEQQIVSIDAVTGATSVLLKGLPLGAPGRLIPGDGVIHPANSLLVADWNAEPGAPCCEGRVFRIDTETAGVTVLSESSPGVSGLGDPYGIAMSPGGDFGEGVYILDVQGISGEAPLLWRINPDGSQSILLQDPSLWTVDTFPADLAFGPAPFGGDLFVADSAIVHAPFYGSTIPTIWRVTSRLQLTVFVAGPPLDEPTAVAFGPGGAFGDDLYVADIEDDSTTTIYRIDSAGTISELATGFPGCTMVTGGCGAPDLVFANDGSKLYLATDDSVFEVSPLNTAPDMAILTLKASAVSGCKSVTGTVTLTGPAPAEGVVITLSDTLASASTPATLKILAGATTKSFTVRTTPVDANESGKVSATLGGKTLSQDLSVRPMGLTSLTLSPTTVVGSKPVVGKATLECKAGPGPVMVDLAGSKPGVANPVAATISIPVGVQSESFDVMTNPVLAKTTATISVTANGITKSKTLNLTSAASVSPTSLKFGNVVINNTSGVLSTTLYNKGAVPFAISSIGLTGTNAKYYAQTSDCGATLDAGASCVIGVTFTPTVTGIKSAKLTVATSATATPLSVALSGTGVLPP
jgi:hypothetical protein